MSGYETKCEKCRGYICDCTCPDVTGYSQKRRLLREQRKTMRVMQGIIWQYGLHGQYSEALEADLDLAQDWWPGPEYQYPDDASDSEDPEKKSRDDLEEYKREVVERPNTRIDGICSQRDYRLRSHGVLGLKRGRPFPSIQTNEEPRQLVENRRVCGDI